MINMICTLFDRIRFTIKPPKVSEAEYWWINISGTPYKIYIHKIDSDIVTARIINSENTDMQHNFIKDIRWIRKCRH